MKTKQVIVMRKDLNMRKGKMCAQAAHAAMWALLNSGRKEVSETGDLVIYTIVAHKRSELPLDEWLLGNYTKICVSCDSLQELLNLEADAKAQGLVTHLQHDLGFTEFNGQDTITCLAIGPDESEKIDHLTRHLPLL